MLTPRSRLMAELKRYMQRFGSADGATYFSAGLSFDAAIERHQKKLAAEKTSFSSCFKAAQQNAAAARR